jgi:hypothetical protein
VQYAAKSLKIRKQVEVDAHTRFATIACLCKQGLGRLEREEGASRGKGRVQMWKAEAILGENQNI